MGRYGNRYADKNNARRSAKSDRTRVPGNSTKQSRRGRSVQHSNGSYVIRSIIAEGAADVCCVVSKLISKSLSSTLGSFYEKVDRYLQFSIGFWMSGYAFWN